MRSMPRWFAALVLTSITAFVRAQESAAPGPLPLDEFGTPVSELRPIPFADGRTSSPEPGQAVDPGAPTEPAAPSAPASAEPSAAVRSQTAQGPSVEVSAIFGRLPVAAIVATAMTDTNPPSPSASIPTRQGRTETAAGTGTGGWILVGLFSVALFASIRRFRSQIPKRSRRTTTPVADLALDPEPAPTRMS